MVIDVREAPSHTELYLRGRLTLTTVAEVRATLTKLLMDRGRVLAEVSELTTRWPAALAVFPAMLANAGGWPWARLVLVGPSPEMARQLSRARIRHAVHVATCWAQACELLHVQPRHLSRHTDLPATLDAPTLARVVARECCVDWNVPELSDRAAIVATELVSNAVQHARTASTVRLSLTPSGLHIAVQDGRATPGLGHRFIDPGVAPDCYGILLVRSLARHVGVTPEMTGKTVWAVLARSP
jgi:anti-sigma regulatory factor (Ser/Thr protein kinase)/anti-anti-sigma regulatory factor